MLPEPQELTVRLQTAYLGVRRLIDRAPLNDEQVNELEEYVKTFWTLAVQLSQFPTRDLQS
jgi:hypothetical protein